MDRPRRYPLDVFYRADPWLHVIAGCMSSGKTDALLRLLRRAEYARRRILLVRPDLDTRTPPDYAESRSLARYPSRILPTDDPWQVVVMARESDADLVGIDEAEFFTPVIVDAVEALRRSGRHVIVTGLNLDFAGRPFTIRGSLQLVRERLTGLPGFLRLRSEVPLASRGTAAAPRASARLSAGGEGQAAVRRSSRRCQPLAFPSRLACRCSPRCCLRSSNQRKENRR